MYILYLIIFKHSYWKLSKTANEYLLNIYKSILPSKIVSIKYNDMFVICLIKY